VGYRTYECAGQKVNRQKASFRTSGRGGTKKELKISLSIVASKFAANAFPSSTKSNRILQKKPSLVCEKTRLFTVPTRTSRPFFYFDQPG